MSPLSDQVTFVFSRHKWMWVTALSEWRRVHQSSGELHLSLSCYLHRSALRDRWPQQFEFCQRSLFWNNVFWDHVYIACRLYFCSCNIMLFQLGRAQRENVCWWRTCFKWAGILVERSVASPMFWCFTKNIFVILYHIQYFDSSSFARNGTHSI